jgi:hypothetical protein
MVRAEFLDELENEIKLLKALVSAQACPLQKHRSCHVPKPHIILLSLSTFKNHDKRLPCFLLLPPSRIIHTL